jgi:hypothetical protein
VRDGIDQADREEVIDGDIQGVEQTHSFPRMVREPTSRPLNTHRIRTDIVADVGRQLRNGRGDGQTGPGLRLTGPGLRHEVAGPLWQPGDSLIPDQIHLPRGTGSTCSLRTTVPSLGHPGCARNAAMVAVSGARSPRWR